jgi:hypothetical protein
MVIPDRFTRARKPHSKDIKKLTWPDAVMNISIGSMAEYHGISRRETPGNLHQGCIWLGDCMGKQTTTRANYVQMRKYFPNFIISFAQIIHKRYGGIDGDFQRGHIVQEYQEFSKSHWPL